MAMRMTTIYRLESPITGTGVFSTSGQTPAVQKALYIIRDIATIEVHPSPQEDIPLKFYERDWNKQYYCATPNLDSLKKWFPTELLRILMCEFNLLEITIPKKFVRFGKSGMQSFYRKEDVVSTKILTKI